MFTRSMLVLAALVIATPNASAESFIDLTIGHSHVVTANGGFATLIVGDDSIADVNVGTAGTIILTGKTLGTTNLIVLDEAGSPILSSTLQVGPVDRRPRSTVRILKGGSNAQEYVCGPQVGCTLSNAGAATEVSLAASAQDRTADAQPSDVEAEESEDRPEGQ